MSMRLHNLKPRPGAKHRRKRLGQGESSGHGKTSGRGGKGQTARSGSGIRPGFEGGQMPLYRKLPHRGFSNFQFATTYTTVKLSDLERFEAGSSIGKDELVAAGLIKKRDKFIKLLGNGDLTKAVHVTFDKFTETAKAKVEQAGGTATVTGRIPERTSAEA